MVKITKEHCNTGAKKFQNVYKPLVYSNGNPHNEQEQKKGVTKQEIKQIHKHLVEKKLFEMYN